MNKEQNPLESCKIMLWNLLMGKLLILPFNNLYIEFK